MGNGNHDRLFKKATAAGLACLLLVAGLPLPAAAEESCKDWKTAKFFKSATVGEVRACLSAGEDPNAPNTKGLTALHRAARETSDPAVIDALLDAGANQRASSIAGRTPWFYARTNGKIKGTAAYERLRMAIASEAKKVAKKADWSRVQAVPRHRKTVVRLYEDAAPPASRRIKGRFVSATPDSITLVLKDGQTRTVHKQDVRKVLTRRPFKKRKPGWIALGVTLAILAAMPLDSDDTRPILAPLAHASITFPTAAAFFYGSRMKGIYNVPIQYRMQPQGDKQPGDEDNTSGKQEDPRGIE